jgi:hypothetical protein
MRTHKKIAFSCMHRSAAKSNDDDDNIVTLAQPAIEEIQPTMVAASGHGRTRQAIERQVRKRGERGKTAWGGGAQR